ncbi:hypothetical protein OESDEN_01530 [Oesophagostomum dentatum]|uniref:Uncharacterized protein n=1 Tax=Oesophagostomum dentatum TaxID=61180 RepID=A0A0B1TMK7_OESDE|nr:hypothetical protein OESDEN_01530 [Oesophagostomum dentatum]
MERGCAARYKGLSDCVDEPKNSTDTDEVTTPLASEAVEEQTTIKVLTTSTESQVESTSTEEAESQKAEPTPVSEEEEDYRDEESAEETTTGVPPQEEHQKETPTSTEAMKTTTTAERTTTTAERTTTSSTTSTSTQTSTTTSKRTTTTTSRATSPETTATRTTTSYVPRTTRYTTTQAPTPTTTTAHVEQLRALPDMPHIPLREDPEEDSEEMRNMERKPQTTSRRTTTTTSMRTTTRATTTPVRIVPPMRKTPVNEPNRELEPSRAEKSQFISPAVKSEGAVPDPSDEETTTQEDPDTKPTTSLINVYEVTTLAVKNKEVHEQWKAPVPWWAAVAVGFLVSVIVAWAVVFYLRK